MGEVLEKERCRPAVWANSSSVLGAEISDLKVSASTTSLFLWGAGGWLELFGCFGGRGIIFVVFPSDQT